MVSETASLSDRFKELAVENEKKYSLKLLYLIRDAQQQHGLRHGDYQRYRGYCSRRLRRLRKSLNLVQGDKRHFKKKEVTEELIKDEKFLLIPLITAERAWSYAMQLKQEANTEPRKRFHMVQRLRKAVAYATLLKRLCEGPYCDPITKLEAQAYGSWIEGILYFELHIWDKAMDRFSQSKTIYEKLMVTLGEDLRNVYQQRIDELHPSIRFCAYNIGDDSAIEDLMNMRGKTGGAELLTELDLLISQTREKQAATLSEVTWRDRTVPVMHEKVRLLLIALKDLEKTVDHSEDLAYKISEFENFLMLCKDALQVMKDELKGETKRSSDNLSSAQYLQAYLSYIRLTKTIERNLLLIETYQVGTTNLEGKKTRPQDVIRMYEMILQNLSELEQLPVIECDSEFIENLNAQGKVYKAYRCLHIAESFRQAEKWGETLAMYIRGESYANAALIHPGVKPADKTKLKALLDKMQGNKLCVQAQSILKSGEASDGNPKVQSKHRIPLIDRMDEYKEDPTLCSGNAYLVDMPPEFEPVPCKPLFFDLALNHIQMPSLEGKLEVKKQGGGLTGFVKGLWGWGEKK